MCTVEKRGNLFILTLTGDDEHRLNPTLISAIRTALADIKSQSLSSPAVPSALITTTTGRFFSNGFDLKWAQSAGAGFMDRLHGMVESFKPVVADLISLPMPTIAAVTGHAAAAGFVLMLAHDYVIMRGDKGVLYMSEVDIGMTFPEYFNVLFKEKVASAVARRDILLRGRKLKAVEAVEFGVVDVVGKDEKEVVAKAVGLGEELVKRKWNGEVYGEIRKGLYPVLCKELGLDTRTLVVPRL
ncbi:enoyl-CoA delta isomerase 2, peroxisomal-like [Silene latifolia]|uniref:enoyl-CoA delta isomerase 2, peroxisomal-like n=1 Tax=Silene latifolia TaxID=37657 RepID=UPI003D7713AD